jgi:hypothetical protein
MASIQSRTDPRVAKSDISLRDRLTNIVASGLDLVETDARRKAFPNISRDMAKDLMPAIENIPIIGQGLAAEDIGEAAKSGNRLDLAMAILGLIPGAGPEKKAAEGVADVTRTMKHGVSANKLRRPLEEMTATHVPAPGPPLLPRKEFNFEEVPIGSHFVPLWGDRTRANEILTGVNEMQFENPVHQQGGSNFTRGPQQQSEDAAYWASNPGVITTQAGRTKALQEGGDPVFAAHVAMGPHSGDYSAQTTNTLMEMLKHSKLTDEAKAAFDKAMREPWTDYGELPDFPGIDKITPEWIANAGDMRKKLAKLMDQGRFQNLGFPDVGSARKAVTDPELLNVPTGSTGHNIVRVGPEAVQAITDPKIPHADYASQLGPGGYVGSTEGVPWNVFWSDWMKTRPPGENPSYTGRAFGMQDVKQKVTQEWLDNLMNYKMSEQGKKLGLAGAIGAGLITAAQARDMFGYEDDESGRARAG